MTDNFRGDNANLIASINALLELDAEGALVPHGVGGHARSLLIAAASRLSASIADTAGAKRSIGAHLWMPADIPAPTEAPPDFGDRKAYAFKAPDAGEHDPWYVVLPNMNALKLGYHADDRIDRQHAEFIAAAINRAIASPAIDTAGAKSFECSLAATAAHDPQSFIDGAKWLESQMAATPASSVADAAVSDRTMAEEWLVKMGLRNSVNEDQVQTLEAFCGFVREHDRIAVEHAVADAAGAKK